MKIVKPSSAGIRQAVACLKAGNSVVYPTDTAYGLAVDATNVIAVKRLYRLKGRHFIKPIHVVVGSLAAAKKLVKFNRKAEKLFKKFLPGPLTLVLPLRSAPIHRPGKLINGRATELLSARTGTLGIRMPKNSAALALARKLRHPITATSANLSGQPACYSAQQVAAHFKKRKFQPDLIVDAGKLPKVKPSTIVALDGESVKILRVGPISRRVILDNLKP